MVSADGSEQAFDPAGRLPTLEEGEFYRFSLTLPEGRERTHRLTFGAEGLELTVYLDGEPVWYSLTAAWMDGARLEPVQLLLPAGGGEVLTMILRPTADSTAVLPPVLRFPVPSGYGLPAEMSSRILVLFWGLFLMNMARGTPKRQLLLPLLAVGLRTLQQIAIRYQGDALPHAVLSALASDWMVILSALAMFLYLALQRRSFWRAFGIFTAVSMGGLLAISAFSAFQNHTWSGTLVGAAAALFRRGNVVGLIYWATL